MNRRDFLKALGFGGLSVARGSMLPAPVLRALRPVAAWARAVSPGDVIMIEAEAAAVAPVVLVTLGFRRDNDQVGSIQAMIQPPDYGSQSCHVVVPFDAMIESASIVVTNPSPVSVRIGVGEYGELRPLRMDLLQGP